MCDTAYLSDAKVSSKSWTNYSKVLTIISPFMVLEESAKATLAFQAAKSFDSRKALAISLIGTPSLSDVIRKMTRFLNVDTEAFSKLEDQKCEVIHKLM